MTGLEYVDRLLVDIKKIMATKIRVADPFSQIKAIEVTGESKPYDFWHALNVIEAESHLDILSQFININEKLLEHEKGSIVDLSIFHRDISKNREQVAETFQGLIDSQTLVDMTTHKPLSDFLIQQLNWVHEVSN